jgi:type I restriction enzyme, R subunit
MTGPASNFSFLAAEWPELHAEAARAERVAQADPRAACFYARRTLELAVAWLFRVDASLKQPYKSDLSAFLFEPSFKMLVGPALHAKMDVVRRQGNVAVHSAKGIAPADALAALRELFHVMFWLARQYGRSAAARPAPNLQFHPDWLAPVGTTPPQSQGALEKLAAQLAERDAAVAAARQKAAALDEELLRLRAEVAAAKADNSAQPDTHDYSEAQTRDLYVDLLLKEAGWPLDQPRDREYEVAGMPNEQGRGFVDYVLWGDDGKPLAVVEAKRTRRDATAGRQQSKLYADCLERQFGQRPLIYYTNGYEHWFWDDSQYPPRPVQGFHKREELQLAVQRRTSRKELSALAIDDVIVERHYQHRAIRRIAETFEQERQRKALVVMATGAGKTRTVIALVQLLMRGNWAKRVLFLADRVALVKQAANAFKAHLPEAPPVNLVTDKLGEGRVFVSTYPTMMGLIDQAQDGQRRFGIGHFDVVIIDEAHRSVYQKYGAIFSYFDSLLVGLTATPKDEVDRNTYSLFELENGVPTDAYGLPDAIAEGYLVPPRAVSVPLKFQREGIRYDDLSEEEKDQWDAIEWETEDGEPPDAVSAEAVNRWLFNQDTVDKVLETLMTRGHRVAGGDRLGKTIVFAKNNAHAEFIAQRFDANYPEHAGHFARVITFKTEYAQSLIDDFSQRDKPPHIAISVDMLDTGIDVPEVVNLVFFKMVRSKTKFWQMVGRGTRLCPNLFGPGQDKQDFFIFDFCQNLEFFNQDMPQTEGSAGKPLGQRLFLARSELVGALDQRIAEGGTQAAEGWRGEGIRLTETEMRAETAALLHRQVIGMNLDNFVVRPERRWVEQWSRQETWQRPTPDQLAEAAGHLSKLPSSVRDDDEEAKRFDLLMLRLQLCALNAQPGFDRWRTQVQEIASALLELDNIPAIRERLLLIERVAGTEWWEDVTVPMLEQARRHLRGLVKLLESRRRKIVYSDFEDELGDAAPVELAMAQGADSFERFRMKARAFLRSHEDRLALHKLRRNQPLTASDLAELERMLAEGGTGSAEHIARAAEESHGLGLFVRSLVGLDRQAATQALDGFVKSRIMAADQLQFVDMVIGHLTENGVMEPALLYESPFTSLAPLGPEQLFDAAGVEQLFGVLRQVEARARAA